jgi:hypothetical protein
LLGRLACRIECLFKKILVSKKISIICFLFTINVYGFGQVSYNQINSSGKKQGLWLCFLNAKFKLTDSIHSKYQVCDYYDDGKNITKIGKNRGLIIRSVELLRDTLNGITKNFSGDATLYNKDQSVKVVEKYFEGRLMSFFRYNKSKNTNFEYCLSEKADYTELYSNNPSFLYELSSCVSQKKEKFIYKKHNGEWKFDSN